MFKHALILFILLFAPGFSRAGTMPPMPASQASTTTAVTAVPAPPSASVSEWQRALEVANKLGPFLSGFGMCVTAATAMAALFLVNVKQRDHAWLESFRALYKEFWQDEDVTFIRSCIVNEAAYSNLAAILSRRNATPTINNLSLEENQVVEKIDRFCATMVRVKSLGQVSKGNLQHSLWTKLYGDFWMGKIRRREELLAYINHNWYDLLDPPMPLSRPARNRRPAPVRARG